MTTSSPSGWIGVDLDGTLAHYDPDRGIHHIGKPIEPMVFRIKQWLEAGVEVRIFTARASEEDLIPPVKTWLTQQGLPALAVTNQKDFDLLQLWDDRVIQLETNTAELLTPKQHITLDVSGWVGVELDGTLAQIDPLGASREVIGDAISKMRMRVQQWIMVGMDVRLFTARAADRKNIPALKAWLKENYLEGMKITCEKDFAMSQFWDDVGVHVISNTGEVTGRVNRLIPARKYA